MLPDPPVIQVRWIKSWFEWRYIAFLKSIDLMIMNLIVTEKLVSTLRALQKLSLYKFSDGVMVSI